ncbi:hypothetical protein JCM8097_007135 [Rhodosporidiobolus ruineniae]
MSTATSPQDSPPKQKTAPIPLELLTAVGTPGVADQLVYEVGLDVDSLRRLFKQNELTSTRNDLLGLSSTSPKVKEWRLQVLPPPDTNSASVKFRVWRWFEDDDKKANLPLAVSLRLFSSNSAGESGWTELESATRTLDTMLDVQKGFAIATLAVRSASSPCVKSTNRSAFEGHNLSRSPHDIKLVFASSSSTNNHLWTSAASLSRLSPYFKTLLSSEFSEAVTYHEGESIDSAAAPSEDNAVDRDEDDSDHEADDAFFSSSSKPVQSSAGSLPYRQITITDATFSTYRALLAHAATGHLRFAHLRSARSARSSDHLSYLKRQVTSTPNTPLPVSAKSIYRLAHFLDIPDACSLALRDFRRQLTPEVATIELFSPGIAHHDALRTTALDYVVKSWPDVKGSEAFRAIKQRIRDGELPHAAQIMVELMDKLEEQREMML